MLLKKKKKKKKKERIDQIIYQMLLFERMATQSIKQKNDHHV
jgi:hypothetical protein